MSEQQQAVRYRPEIFDVTNLDDAQSIILTPERGTSTAERWQKETPYLADEIGRWLQPNPETCILDYGCGVGRLAKELIERHGCYVLGVDFSLSMRQLAPGYVGSDRFSVCSPQFLTKLAADGFRADHAISTWVLQHCPAVAIDIETIKSALADEGLFYVLNQYQSCIPTDKGWVSDGRDIRALLLEDFDETHKSQMPDDVTTPGLAASSYISILKKKSAVS